jgi:hypothetical protein
MRGKPISPQEYAAGDGSGETPVLTDEKLAEQGWAHGLGVWDQIGKAYEWYLSTGGDKPDGLDNAQMWSLQEAIRAEAIREFAEWVYYNGGEDGHGGDDVRHEVTAFEARTRGGEVK